ncbi:MAG: electron transfer flavoprotein subunit alpha/FixB family protein [Bacteroidia bacterium]|nr:electron transfer flavoprotein subunit alpha/FixB family protein [Bacteroidia bacterium]NNF29822.1 electron transfer flavoprotein subunit alpha/FixB family protein [Flavobacteriaceae bacterium]MBT8275978.1 electron transfer flavoprotein subunit alpha/FixB family protein [Bacteroidia bacterium]NNJ80824.1 electron transfer flavoprotein subunit alpha/FixB family protein [Flavobacteriaceae bacterium]NNK53818.1 electron transfer flavoprotein subunit alpha/FixB family protein [Flavobacteriaceae ba
MMVLVYTESEGGKFKKIAHEAVSYAKGIADMLGTSVTAVAVNADDASELGNYGASKVLNVANDSLHNFNAGAYADVVSEAAKNEGANVVVLTSSANSKFMAPLVAVNLNAGYVPNVNSLPESATPFKVNHSVFTNKAFASTEITTNVKVIGLAKNAYGVLENSTSVNVEAFAPEVSNGDSETVSVDKATDKVTIADAEIVVSAGRGMKGPENWGMIEELAETLGAATACSKPVSDMGWRPHAEHVGQTGKPVATNLYIAIGISGAIQHLAGINASKVKVVINNDPEAPFFKAADYGIVGDAFEVVPQLTEKLKAFKAQNA